MSKKQVSKFIVSLLHCRSSDVIAAQLLVCLLRLEMGMKVCQRAVVTASRV